MYLAAEDGCLSATLYTSNGVDATGTSPKVFCPQGFCKHSYAFKGDANGGECVGE